MAAYEEILKKSPIAFVDEGNLPMSKPYIKEALRIAWREAPNDDRERLRNLWINLKYFQAGVGNVPLSATPKQFGENDKE